MRLLPAALCPLLAATCLAGTAGHGSPPVLRVGLSGDAVAVDGDVSSEAHGRVLERIAVGDGAARKPTLHLNVRRPMPPGWALLAEQSVSAMSALRAGKAVIDARGVRIEGIAADSDAWLSRAAGIRAALLPGMAIVDRVVVIPQPVDFELACIRLFRTALVGRRIEFPRSGAVLGSAARPLLDELAGVVTDCPGSFVSVTGHTDNIGDEAVNVAVSEARARAVAGYLVSRGIDASRVTASGAGSSRPLVAGDTAHAHRLNRRVDLSLQFSAGLAADAGSTPSMPSSSTTNTSVAPGGISAPAPRSP